MRAWIITAAPVKMQDLDFYRSVKPKESDIVICADGGYDNALNFGITPDLVIGDFDSCTSRLPETLEVIQHPRNKDKTDTHLAVEYALENGAEEVILLGNLSGRIDHTLAVIYLLRIIKDNDAEGLVLSSKERICLIRNEKTVISRGDNKWLTLIPLSERCEGVSIKRTKYELENETLKLGDTLGVSNEFTALDAHVSVKKGELLVIAN